MDFLLLALPFAVTAVMYAIKWLGGFAAFNNGADAKPLLRLFLAVLSIVGVGALNLLSGTPVDADSLTTLIKIAAEAAASAFLSHGVYTAAKVS
jgi:hypothetical protein